jgi:malate/lactate dehydrogenase
MVLARCSSSASTASATSSSRRPDQTGAGGVEQINEIALTSEEDAALKKSAAAVKELTDVIKV